VFLSAAQFIIRLRKKIVCKGEKVRIVVHWDCEILKCTVFRFVRKIAGNDY